MKTPNTPQGEDKCNCGLCGRCNPVFGGTPGESGYSTPSADGWEHKLQILADVYQDTDYEDIIKSIHQEITKSREDILRKVLEPKGKYNVDMGHYIDLNKEHVILQRLVEQGIDVHNLMV